MSYNTVYIGGTKCKLYVGDTPSKLYTKDEVKVKKKDPLLADGSYGKLSYVQNGLTFTVKIDELSDRAKYYMNNPTTGLFIGCSIFSRESWGSRSKFLKSSGYDRVQKISKKLSRGSGAWTVELSTIKRVDSPLDTVTIDLQKVRITDCSSERASIFHEDIIEGVVRFILIKDTKNLGRNGSTLRGLKTNCNSCDVTKITW